MPERLDIVTEWAQANWPGETPAGIRAEAVAPDGSTRFFARLTGGDQSLVAMHCPGNIPEAKAWHHIAGVLADIGAPVPTILAADADAGLFLMSDLGSGNLHQAFGDAGNEDEAATLYEPVLAALARIQAHGAEKLDTSYCFDGAELSAEFLLKREAGYFLEWFVRAACGVEPGRAVAGDLAEVCALAAGAGPWGLVHRDFQSRNIVIGANGPGIVDFQGARLGPAQYDLASLLHDPYADLPWSLRGRLLNRYIELRSVEGFLDEEMFRRGLPFVSLSRVMQALGAYGFLCLELKKTFFAGFARPALATLRGLLAGDEFNGFAALRGLAAELPDDPEPLLAAPAGDR